MALAFCNGRPFRKPFYTNLLFIGSLIGLLILGIIFLLWRVEFLDEIMGVNFIDRLSLFSSLLKAIKCQNHG